MELSVNRLYVALASATTWLWGAGRNCIFFSHSFWSQEHQDLVDYSGVIFLSLQLKCGGWRLGGCFCSWAEWSWISFLPVSHCVQPHQLWTLPAPVPVLSCKIVSQGAIRRFWWKITAWTRSVKLCPELWKSHCQPLNWGPHLTTPGGQEEGRDGPACCWGEKRDKTQSLSCWTTSTTLLEDFSSIFCELQISEF